MKTAIAIAALALLAATAHAETTVMVMEYKPDPRVRLRMTNSHEGCPPNLFTGQFTHTNGFSIEMCYTRDPVTKRFLVFYPDGVQKAFAPEDLRFIAEVR